MAPGLYAASDYRNYTKISALSHWRSLNVTMGYWNLDGTFLTPTVSNMKLCNDTNCFSFTGAVEGIRIRGYSIFLDCSPKYISALNVSHGFFRGNVVVNMVGICDDKANVPSPVSSPIPPSPPSSPPSSSSSSSIEIIIGAVIGGGVLLLLFLFCYFSGYFKLKQQSSSTSTSSSPPSKLMSLELNGQARESTRLDVNSTFSNSAASHSSPPPSPSSTTPSQQQPLSPRLISTSSRATSSSLSSPKIEWSDLALTSNTANAVLGKGSFGTVVQGSWKPKQSKLAKDVAVKVFTQSSADTTGKEFEAILSVVNQEASILVAADAVSTRVVKLYGVVEGTVSNELADFFRLQRGVFCIGLVMAWKDGGTLHEYLHGKDNNNNNNNNNNNKRSLSSQQKLSLLQEIAHGIAELHDANIIHGDIKPMNILLNNNNHNPTIHFTDFSFAKLHQTLTATAMGASSLLQTQSIKGTPVYSAPERLLNPFLPIEEGKLVAQPSRKTDMYSFGLLTWEIMTQQQPFATIPSEAELCVVVHRNIRPPLEQLDNISNNNNNNNNNSSINTPNSVKEIIECNWSSDRKLRKTATECYSILLQQQQVEICSRFDIFFSHASSSPKSKAFLSHVFAELVKLRYRVWFDVSVAGCCSSSLSSSSSSFSGTTSTAAATAAQQRQQQQQQGIAQSTVVLVCVDKAERLQKKTLTVAIEANPFAWATTELKDACHFQTRMFADLGEVAALEDWNGDNNGPTEEMLLRLREAMKSLVKLLESIDCFPSALDLRN